MQLVNDRKAQRSPHARRPLVNQSSQQSDDVEHNSIRCVWRNAASRKHMLASGKQISVASSPTLAVSTDSVTWPCSHLNTFVCDCVLRRQLDRAAVSKSISILSPASKPPPKVLLNTQTHSPEARGAKRRSGLCALILVMADRPPIRSISTCPRPSP